MRTYTEQRGNYQITCYEVNISPLMKKLALDFSVDLIGGDNQYNRLMPGNIDNAADEVRIRVQRTYMGKVAELAFAKLLLEKEKQFSTAKMFQIYEGQENGDKFDFANRNGSIDIKCGFRDNHQRLVVNTNQFDSPNHKDFYVAVKLNAVDIDRNLKLVDLDSVTTGRILGYAEHEYLRNKAEIINLGEGPARTLYYNELLGIDRLLDLF